MAIGLKKMDLTSSFLLDHPQGWMSSIEDVNERIDLVIDRVGEHLSWILELTIITIDSNSGLISFSEPFSWNQFSQSSRSEFLIHSNPATKHESDSLLLP